MSSLQDIGDFLTERCGFESPDERTLRKAVDRRLLETGLSSVAAYLAHLRPHPREVAELVNLVVVPETFFFRYPASFRALAEWAADRPARPLRILSLACSTGEEPYSIAMTLLDAGLSEVDFVIEARDLSTAAISLARRGLYSSKSFREVSGNWRSRYFADDVQVLPQLKRVVDFGVENLLHLEDKAKWDAIFCRNSLIYFPLEEQKKIAELIDRALVSDGIIFIGPAEPPLFIDSGWAPSGYPMSFSCIRRAARVPPSAKPLAPLRPVPKSRPAPNPRPATAPAPPKPIVFLEEARALADAGRLDEAQAMLTSALKADPANADAHFLQGVVEEARGHLDLAESNYRKSLYLAPGHAEALQHMALLVKSQGRGLAASRLHRRATRHPVP
ncbi:protein-glutamate O-methyltransferase CheR [soil metagenome]